MRNVVCPHCHESVAVPDNLTQAHCVRCGQAMTIAEPRETSISSAIQPAAQAEWTPRASTSAEPPATYSDWEEFRTMSPFVQRAWADLATTALPDLRNLDCEPLPANTPRHADELGNHPLASLAVAGDNRLMVHFLSLVMLFFGFFIAYIILFENRQGFEPKHPLFQRVLYGAMPIVGGFALAYWISFWRDPNHPITYWFMEEGLIWERDGTIDACRWADLETLETADSTGTFVLTITLPTGLRTTLRSAANPEFAPLLEFIRAKATAARFLPFLRRVFEGHSVSFGLVRLDRSGLRHRRFAAHWSDVVKVVVDPRSLFIDCKNQPVWYAIRHRDVSFEHLVVVISHIMIEEHGRLPRREA